MLYINHVKNLIGGASLVSWKLTSLSPLKFGYVPFNLLCFPPDGLYTLSINLPNTY